jgi:DNA-binding SARP family transcriptional activator
VISYEILDGVTARQDAWTASLSRQQRHLLAALVLGKGAPVSRERLEEILWDSQAPYDPERAVNRIACEVRSELRLASPGGDDPLPSSHGGYRLSVVSEQADVLRFRARVDEARRTDGPASVELMRQALREWGPDAVGLHGGHPLRGLPGQWADSTRHLLRTQYRDAVVHCLTQGMRCHDYRPVLTECEQRAAGDPQALLDDEFVGLWMLAAAGTGDRTRAHTVFQRAADAAARSGQQPSNAIRQLDADLRAGQMPPGMIAAVVPSEIVLLSAGPRQVNEVNYEVSVVNEQDPDDDASVPPATGQQAVPDKPVLTAHSDIKADRIADGATVTGISADPGPGIYDSKARVGSIEGQFTGVDLRKRN